MKPAIVVSVREPGNPASRRFRFDDLDEALDCVARAIVAGFEANYQRVLTRDRHLEAPESARMGA